MDTEAKAFLNTEYAMNGVLFAQIRRDCEGKNLGLLIAVCMLSLIPFTISMGESLVMLLPFPSHGSVWKLPVNLCFLAYAIAAPVLMGTLHEFYFRKWKRKFGASARLRVDISEEGASVRWAGGTVCYFFDEKFHFLEGEKGFCLFFGKDVLVLPKDGFSSEERLQLRSCLEERSHPVPLKIRYLDKLPLVSMGVMILWFIVQFLYL